MTTSNQHVAVIIAAALSFPAAVSGLSLSKHGLTVNQVQVIPSTCKGLNESLLADLFNQEYTVDNTKDWIENFTKKHEALESKKCDDGPTWDVSAAKLLMEQPIFPKVKELKASLTTEQWEALLGKGDLLSSMFFDGKQKTNGNEKQERNHLRLAISMQAETHKLVYMKRQSAEIAELVGPVKESAIFFHTELPSELFSALMTGDLVSFIFYLFTDGIASMGVTLFFETTEAMWQDANKGMSTWDFKKTRSFLRAVGDNVVRMFSKKSATVVPMTSSFLQEDVDDSKKDYLMSPKEIEDIKQHLERELPANHSSEPKQPKRPFWKFFGYTVKNSNTVHLQPSMILEKKDEPTSEQKEAVTKTNLDENMKQIDALSKYKTDKNEKKYEEAKLALLKFFKHFAQMGCKVLVNMQKMANPLHPLAILVQSALSAVAGPQMALLVSAILALVQTMAFYIVQGIAFGILKFVSQYPALEGFFQELKKMFQKLLDLKNMATKVFVEAFRKFYYKVAMRVRGKSSKVAPEPDAAVLAFAAAYKQDEDAPTIVQETWQRVTGAGKATKDAIKFLTSKCTANGVCSSTKIGTGSKTKSSARKTSAASFIQLHSEK